MTVNSKKIITIITAAVALLYTGIIVGWHLYTPRDGLTIQNPGADNRPEGTARSIDDVHIGLNFMRYDDIVSNLTGKWTKFRGANLDNIIVAPETLNFPEGDFPVVWSVETGEGYAAPVIYNGRFYILDYDEALSSDALRCFDLATGRELWRRWYRVQVRKNHGFSRTVPAIGEGYIITIGPRGHVMSCDPITGEMLWSIDMQKEFGSIIPDWHLAQCPLVVDGVLILATAGEEILMIGVDVLTGETLWTTPNTPNFDLTHSSVTPMTLAGKKMYVYIGIGGVGGVSAEGADIGELLWETSRWHPARQGSPSPLQISPNRMFVSAGYGTGGAVLQIDRQGDRWAASVVEQWKPDAGMSSETHTPILYNNMLITVFPKSVPGNRERLSIYSPSNLRAPVWTSEAGVFFGNGPFTIINNYLFALMDIGELRVYEIQQNGMRFVKQQHLFESVEAGGPLAYADGLLLLGDMHEIKALRISD